jgi:hypothetical protein
MKLWLIYQRDNTGWDTYDSAVVAAETEDEARLIHPGNGKWNDRWSAWASTPDKVHVDYIGEAKDGTEHGVVLASFNAG